MNFCFYTNISISIMGSTIDVVLDTPSVTSALLILSTIIILTSAAVPFASKIPISHHKQTAHHSRPTQIHHGSEGIPVLRCSAGDISRCQQYLSQLLRLIPHRVGSECPRNVQSPKLHSSRSFIAHTSVTASFKASASLCTEKAGLA
jgi:hypothetical protein